MIACRPLTASSAAQLCRATTRLRPRRPAGSSTPRRSWIACAGRPGRGDGCSVLAWPATTRPSRLRRSTWCPPTRAWQVRTWWCRSPLPSHRLATRPLPRPGSAPGGPPESSNARTPMSLLLCRVLLVWLWIRPSLPRPLLLLWLWRRRRPRPAAARSAPVTTATEATSTTPAAPSHSSPPGCPRPAARNSSAPRAAPSRLPEHTHTDTRCTLHPHTR
mmetsp:Transcript_34112/g.84400  ORF Transcript_34112/g.84400 Transcript_34112/m.84400 type:complete len:218 (-) Transcript_34112:944-1597(-)